MKKIQNINCKVNSRKKDEEMQNTDEKQMIQDFALCKIRQIKLQYYAVTEQKSDTTLQYRRRP